MPRFTNADDARTYLASLSDHPNRPGDTSRLHPQYAIAMANSIAEARAAGMPVRLLSGQREGNVTNSKYDRGGYSSHTYGIASDVSGIGGPGSGTASQWRKIAEANGLSSPYDPKGKEWNHWQFGPKLEDDPKLLGRLREAHARGNDVAMWDAYQPTGTATAYNEPAKTVTAPAVDAINAQTGSGATLSHEQFIRDYARKIGINPDQAVAIARAEGLNAWSKSNPNAGSYVDRTNGVPWSFGDFQLNTRNGMGVDAIKAGIDPKDPNQWQAADKFALDQMREHGVGAWSNPVARNIAAHGGLTLNTPQAEGVVDPGIVARGGTSPAIPDASGGTATAAAAPAPGVLESLKAGNAGDALKALLTKPPTKVDENGKEVAQKSPAESLAAHLGAGEKEAAAAAPAEMAAPPVAVDTMAGMAPAAQQLWSTVSQSAARPLTWTSSPYGSNAGLQRGQIGTSLANTEYPYG